MEFEDVFHGIWACAILGHFSPDRVKDIMAKILRALKDDGICIFPFKRETETVTTMADISMIMTERLLMTFWTLFQM